MPFLLTSLKLWPRLWKKSLTTQEKLEELDITYLNGIYIYVSWYSKICWFPVKNAEISRTQGVCRVIHIVTGFSLGKVKLCQGLSLQDMCDRFQGGGTFLPPPHPWAAPKKPILNRVKCISGINLSPPNKNLLTISFILCI